MSQDVERVIQTIQQLSASEQNKVLQWLEENKPSADKKLSEAEIESEVDRKLLARGIIKEIPVGLTDEEDDFEPIEIEGEPISEMIIRERR